MKQKNQKHGKESLIGKIIYGFLMFMPLLAILTTCAYVIFNKNAYQSYSDDYIEEITEINSNTIIANTNYVFKYDSSKLSSTNSPMFKYSEISIDWAEYSNYSNAQVNQFRIYNTDLSYRAQISLYYNDTYVGNTDSIWGITLFEFTCKLVSASNNNSMPQYDLYIFNYQEHKLDNVFYYSIDKVEQSPLFNWSKNTGTYTVLENTCQTLSISTTFVPLLLSYWLMMSLMYLLYDIALLIVHMAHNRIHDIESSI